MAALGTVMAECQNCGDDDDIAIDDYDIVICHTCLEDDACPELFERYLDERRKEAKEATQEADSYR